MDLMNLQLVHVLAEKVIPVEVLVEDTEEVDVDEEGEQAEDIIREARRIIFPELSVNKVKLVISPNSCLKHRKKVAPQFGSRRP